MVKPLVNSSVDVALWFFEQANQDERHLSMRRLQQILFLAQLTCAERYQGAQLMPAYFMVKDGIPFEPNIFRIFSAGSPILGKSHISGHIAIFLEEIWSQQSNISLEKIDRALIENSVYANIVTNGDGEVIDFPSMLKIAACELASLNKVGNIPKIQKPSTETLQDGRQVRQWQPRSVKPSKHFLIETIKR